MDKNLFYERRQRLLPLCEDGSMLLLFANSDKGISFVQNNNFFYLTGLHIPEAILMITKTAGKINSEIFIERTIPERIVWDGEKMSCDEVKRISGIGHVHYLDRFEPELTSHIATSNNVLINTLYIEGNSLAPNESMNKPLQFAARLRERYPAMQFGCLSTLIHPLRMVKDKWELEQLMKAIEITGKGVKSVLQSDIAGKYEYQVEAILQYELINAGAKNWGFKPIIAAGKNATILHYCSNNQVIGGKDLLLMDVGGLYNNYCADISRTIPVGKKFSKRQKAVYAEVLEVQKTIIDLVEPGITLKNLNMKTVDLITEALFRLKLIKNKEEYRNYYMHSVSHFLGMIAHDVNTTGAILEPGHVITVEPGIYIPEEGIGVRIEDDILVTNKGSAVLSAEIPKEIEELEELRSNIK